MPLVSRRGLKLDDVRTYGEQTFGDLFYEALRVARNAELAMVVPPVRRDWLARLVELVVLRTLEEACDDFCDERTPRAEIDWED